MNEDENRNISFRKMNQNYYYKNQKITGEFKRSRNHTKRK